MQLTNPAFPISFPRGKADAVIKKAINARGWSDYKVLQAKLVYHPYLLFNFHGFKKSEEEKGEGVKDEIQQKMALDALTDEFNESVSSLAEKKPVSNQVIKDEEVEVLSFLISEEEAKEILPLKLSAKFDIPRSNVFVTGMRMVYVPEWKYIVEVETKTYDISMNAVIGNLDGDEKIPWREKTWNEVIRETITELQNPGAWVKYSSATIKDFSSLIGGTSTDSGTSTADGTSILKELLTNTKLQIIILGIIAVIVIILFYFA